MEEIEDNPSEVNSCFHVMEPLRIDIVDLNKKRKLQAEPLELPTPKHQCWDRHFTAGPVFIFGEVDSIKDGTELESDKESNVMADDSDAAMAMSMSLMCPNDMPSTSSVSCNYSPDRFGESKVSETRKCENNYSPDRFGESKVSETRKCENLGDHVLRFEDIEQCSDEELELILNSDGLNSNKFVLSSGRWSVNQESQQNSRKPTIDQEFEEYFSMLML